MCPLFLPASTISLTGLFSGECSVDAGALIPLSVLRQCCNPGHARAVCARAAAIEPDAVQLLVKAERDGIVEVAWAMERNHHPVAVGTLQVSPAPDLPNQLLERQARAVAAHYLRQTGRG